MHMKLYQKNIPVTTIDEIKNAILRGDNFYKHIKLPKGQIGTNYQKESYAIIKAKELYQRYYQNPLDSQIKLSLGQKLATVDLTQIDVAILHVLLILKEHYLGKKQRKSNHSHQIIKEK